MFETRGEIKISSGQDGVGLAMYIVPAGTVPPGNSNWLMPEGVTLARLLLLVSRLNFYELRCTVRTGRRSTSI